MPDGPRGTDDAARRSTIYEMSKTPDVAADERSVAEAIEVPAVDHDEQQDEPQKGDVETNGTRASQKPVVSALDWDGPDDPENPHNWSFARKMGVYLPMCFLSFAVSIGSSLVSPATEAFEESFHVSRTAAILPLTLYVIGLGLGPMLSAPLSEKYGRSIVYQVTAPLCILFLLGAGLSKTFAGLLICRLLAGLSGAAVLAAGTGTTADLFRPQNLANPVAYGILCPFLGPALGPLIGGFCVYYRDWQWTIWSNIVIVGAAFVACLPMRESYKKIILARRARRLGLPPPPPGPDPATWAYWKALVTVTLLRPGAMLIREPIVSLLAAYSSFAFCVNFSFFPAFDYVFARVYGFNSWQIGLTYLGLGIGVTLAAFTTTLIHKYVYVRRAAAAATQGRGPLPPEETLWGAMLGSIGLPLGLFWFAWTAREDVHWIVPIVAGIWYGWGSLLLFIGAATFQLHVYGPLYGASAMAANGLARYVLGGCFPLWTIQMYGALGIGWATSLLGFVSVAMLPIPFLFYRYGRRIRKSSRYSINKN